MMLKRPRPYIPLSVRVEVAERDCFKGPWWPLYCSAVEMGGLTLSRRLTILLGHLPGAELDHDPALILRKINRRTGKYTPDANDPAYLIYREKDEHLEKTVGRKPGAERTITAKGSDMWLRNKFRKLEGKPKRKVKIPSRPFQKRK